MNGQEIIQELQNNFTRNNLLQFHRKEALDLLQSKFEKEVALKAVHKLFNMFQLGMGTDDKFPAVIHPLDIDYAIKILDLN